MCFQETENGGFRKRISVDGALLYINDISNCSNKLDFRIFADDTNVFASSPSIREKLINEELAKIKEWCDLNKLSINIKKTNYMIVKSLKKKSGNNIKNYQIKMEVVT